MSAIGTFFQNLGSSLASAAQSGFSGLVGQAIGGLGNALFGGISAKRNWKYYKKQANLDHQYNIQTMDHAAQIAKDQYAYEYEMESPEARVKQLRDAGLNKGLAYSGGATGMQGSVSSPAPATSRGSMPNMSDSSLAHLATIGSTLDVNKSVSRRNDSEAEYFEAKADEVRKKLPHEVDNLVSRTDYNRAAADLASANASITRYDEALRRSTEADTVEQKRLQTQIMGEQFAQMLLQSEGLGLDNENKRLTIQYQMQKLIEQRLDIFIKQYDLSFKPFELQQIQATIGKIISDTNLSKAIERLSNIKADLSQKQYENYELQMYWNLGISTANAVGNLIGQFTGLGRLATAFTKSVKDIAPSVESQKSGKPMSFPTWSDVPEFND